jgi:hypothetical protein
MKHQGLLSGLLGCVFGILGILTFGLIFVPLAAICSLIGLLRGFAGLSISGIGCSLLAAVLTVWGFVVSPTLWLLGAGLLAYHQAAVKQSPAQSATAQRAIAAVGQPTTAQQKATPPITFQFNQFPVNEIYHGQLMMPDFVKRDKEFKNYRTRLRNGIKEGVNFAGHYKIIQIGCGTECTFNYLADVSTGQIFKGLPLGGEDNIELQLQYQISSKLLRAWWNNHPFDGNICSEEDFILENNEFISMTDPISAACPRNCDDNGYCAFWQNSSGS